MQPELDAEDFKYREEFPFVALLHDNEDQSWAIKSFPTKEEAQSQKLPKHTTEVMTWEQYDEFKLQRLTQARKDNPPIVGEIAD